MKRRDFITLLGGAAAWPLAARAQQAERIRHIGVLMASSENDPEAQSWTRGFREELGKLGWTEGHNIQIDTRWAPKRTFGPADCCHAK
jgi:putative tryptophan/tyrosine transport system substrate-binding protein